jgi:hypothetical protein
MDETVHILLQIYTRLYNMESSTWFLYLAMMLINHGHTTLIYLK